MINSIAKTKASFSLRGGHIVFFFKMSFLGMIAASFVAFFLLVYIKRGRELDNDVVKARQLRTSISNPKIIWWTDRLYPHFELDEMNVTCSKGDCFTTKNRNYLEDPETGAFIFYGTDFEAEDLPLPRHSRHEWALFHEESPLNNFIFSHHLGISLFNFTATFGGRSDYPLGTQFIPGLNYLVERSPVDIDRKNRLRREGYAPAVYVQSHCFVPSDRDRYVLELSKHLEIDSYGSCLRNKSLPDRINGTESYDDGEFLDLLADYKFILAFENAICEDYVTEKLFRSFHVGSVPIYRGSPNAAFKWSPDLNRSIITTDDFDSPESLGRFLNDLDRNDDAYSGYLKYKTEGVTNDFLTEQLRRREWGINDENKVDFIRGFECYVCDRLIERREDESKGLIVQPRMANSEHVNCPEPGVSLPLDKGGLPPNDEWLRQGWVESFWYAYDVARAIHDMIGQEETDSSRVHDYAFKMKLLH